MKGDGIEWILVLTLLVIGSVWYYLHAATNTGPNCPGMDPAWIGWCEPQPRD